MRSIFRSVLILCALAGAFTSNAHAQVSVQPLSLADIKSNGSALHVFRPSGMIRYINFVGGAVLSGGTLTVTGFTGLPNVDAPLTGNGTSGSHLACATCVVLGGSQTGGITLTGVGYFGGGLTSASIQGIGNVLQVFNARTVAGETLGFAPSASTVTSASTIAPDSMIQHVSGTAAIATITVPATISSAGGGCIELIPDGAFTTTTAANIGKTSTATVGRTMEMCWDGTKWWPSY